MRTSRRTTRRPKARPLGFWLRERELRDVQDIRRLGRRQTVDRPDPGQPSRQRRRESDCGRARDLGKGTAAAVVAVRCALAAGEITRAAFVVAGRVAARGRQAAHVEREHRQQNYEDRAPHGTSIARHGFRRPAAANRPDVPSESGRQRSGGTSRRSGNLLVELSITSHG